VSEYFRSVAEALNSGDVQALSAYFTPDLIPTVTANFAGTRTVFPDAQYMIDKIIDQGDHIVFTYTGTGTHKQTGKTVRWEGTAFATLRHGKIGQLEVSENHAGRALAMRQDLVVGLPPSGIARAAVATQSAGEAAVIGLVNGTWVGSSDEITVTLSVEQTGSHIEGTAAISGFSDIYRVQGLNAAPRTPNVIISSNVVGIWGSFYGNFSAANRIDGTLNLSGFSPMNVAIVRR